MRRCIGRTNLSYRSGRVRSWIKAKDSASGAILRIVGDAAVW